MSSLKDCLFSVIIIVVCAVLGSCLSSKKESKKKKPNKEQVALAHTLIAKGSSLSPIIFARGRVSSRNDVALEVEQTAKVLATRFYLREGQSFRKGQVLLQLENTQANLRWKTAVSDLMSTLATVLPDWERDFPENPQVWRTFLGELSFTKLPVLPEAQNLKEKLWMSNRKVFTLYFAAQNAKDILAKHIIKAPFSGSVSRSMILPGAIARPGKTIAMLTSIQKVEIEASVPSKGQLALQLKQEVILSENNREYKGTVDRISKEINPQSQTKSFWVSTLAKVSPGSLVNLKIPLPPQENMLRLPREAMLKDLVYIIADDKLDTLRPTNVFVEQDSILVQIPDGTVVVTQALESPWVGQKMKSWSEAE